MCLWFKKKKKKTQQKKKIWKVHYVLNKFNQLFDLFSPRKRQSQMASLVKSANFKRRKNIKLT